MYVGACTRAHVYGNQPTNKQASKTEVQHRHTIDFELFFFFFIPLAMRTTARQGKARSARTMHGLEPSQVEASQTSPAKHNRDNPSRI